jgi:hypothetical protein
MPPAWRLKVEQDAICKTAAELGARLWQKSAAGMRPSDGSAVCCNSHAHGAHGHDAHGHGHEAPEHGGHGGVPADQHRHGEFRNLRPPLLRGASPWVRCMQRSVLLARCLRHGWVQASHQGMDAAAICSAGAATAGGGQAHEGHEEDAHDKEHKIKVLSDATDLLRLLDVCNMLPSLTPAAAVC